MLIDARGQGCPKPVLMAEDALSRIQEGIVEILVDNEASVNNLSRFANKNGLFSETAKEEDHWRVKIVKGYPCEIPKDEEKTQEPQKGQPTQGLEKGISSAPVAGQNVDTYFLIVATDTMGKEEELGRILMKGFFDTMRVYKEVPERIFFLNAGVKLTTINDDIFPIIKDIADMGVEIYTCGTCLKYYNLESDLKVGNRGTTNHIVEGMKDFKKTVWIG